MTATEELRRLLDERGIEWSPSAFDREFETFYKAGGVGFLATELSSGRMKVGIEGYLTPAKAVEATLGRGMLTADDVRDLIERHSDASGGNGRDFHDGAYVSIADELNSTLGHGTCHNVWDTELTGRLRFQCSECGAVSVEITPRFCPNCGREVVA